MEDQVLTYDEVADYLQISVPQVKKLRAKDAIPYIKIGSSVRFLKSKITEWLIENSR